MIGNPLVVNTAFYKLTWGDLQSRMPFASKMQMYDAAEKLTNILNETFTEEARKLAFLYDERDRNKLDPD